MDPAHSEFKLMLTDLGYAFQMLALVAALLILAHSATAAEIFEQIIEHEGRDSDFTLPFVRSILPARDGPDRLSRANRGAGSILLVFAMTPRSGSPRSPG